MQRAQLHVPDCPVIPTKRAKAEMISATSMYHDHINFSKGQEITRACGAHKIFSSSIIFPGAARKND